MNALIFNLITCLFALVIPFLNGSEIITEELRGIRFVGDEAFLCTDLPCSEDSRYGDLYFSKLKIHNQRPEPLCRICNRFIGRALSLDDLERLKIEISRDYMNRGYPFVVVTIPEQDITQGYLQIVVTEGVLGEIQCVGNRHFPDACIKKNIQCCEGEPIYLPRLLNDLAWINRNPFRRSSVVFTPGTVPGTTNLLLETTERNPLLVYGSLDNTGTKETGSERISAGFKYGNLWNREHVLTYQFTSAANLRKFRCHNVDYLMPLPWRHTLDLYGSWAKTRPDFDDHVHCQGISWQAWGRYEIPTNLNPQFLQNGVIGFDFKRTNNDLAFGGETIIHHLVDVAQFMCGWNVSQINQNYEIYLNIEGYASPGHMTKNDTTREYKKLQPGAKCQYAYAWGSLNYIYHLPKCMQLSVTATGQGSSENLLPSEQLELAGFYAVRGYPEHKINVDNGYVFNVELHSPTVNLIKSWCDELYLLCFFDYGYGKNHHIEPGVQKSYELISMGPGLRYNIGTNAALRIDWGIQLKALHAHMKKSSRVHAGFFASY